jgi:hypothetical protein
LRRAKREKLAERRSTVKQPDRSEDSWSKNRRIFRRKVPADRAALASRQESST